ncbi:MAG TPA: hypothetical protein VM580_07895 [Labilithrix sp.]|nr:hypothetical protein [Labilithrix sp.]
MEFRALLICLVTTAAVVTPGCFKDYLGSDETVPESGADASSDASSAGEACTPRCSDDQRSILCAGGVADAAQPCALGCVDGPRCAALDPEGPATVDDYANASANVHLYGPDASDAGGIYILNTDNGSISSGIRTANGVDALKDGERVSLAGISMRTARQPKLVDGGAESPEIAIFGFRSLHVAEGATLRIIGTRAAALITREAMEIDGLIDADCDQSSYSAVPRAYSTAGPGGYGPADNDSPGRGGDSSASSKNCNVGYDTCVGGGGGGGHGTSGGMGGKATNSIPGAAGEKRTRSEVFILLGGSSGGFPAPNAVGGNSFPGAGGGAVQLGSSGLLRIGARGVVSAAGCGGGVGTSIKGGGGGGGGGAGGMIVLEAGRIELAPNAVIAANGGGGAPGSSNEIAAGGDGERGRHDDQPASGGLTISTNSDNSDAGCRGGNGGTLNAATAGEDSPFIASTRIGGGGGGAAGRILVRGELISAGATISPGPDVAEPTKR